MVELPKGFEHLAIGLEWALPTERQRFNKRIAGPMSALEAYYQLMTPNMQAVLTYLKTYDTTDDLSAETLNLYYMALSYMEVSNSVERFHEPDESGVFAADRYHVKGPEDIVVGYV